MPKSKKPRKPYRRPDFGSEAAALNPEKYGERGRPLPEKGSEEAKAFDREMGSVKMPEDTVRFPDPPAKPATPRKPRAPKAVPVDKEPPAPAHPHVVHPSSPRALSGRGRYLVPVAAGAGVIGGGAFLAHRARRRKAEMAKGLIDPTTGRSVSYERVYIDDVVDKRHDETALQHHGSRRGGRLAVSSRKVPGLPVQSATFSRGNPEARPGTRSHANKLTHVHTNVKASRTGKLLLVKHGRRSKSGTSVGKSAGFAQAGGRGRRLVNI